MKVSTKFKIVASILSVVGITLIILGTTVFKIEECLNCGQGWEGHVAVFGEHKSVRPNFVLMIPGIFITFISLPLWVVSFTPNIAKAQADIHSEVLDYAGEEIKEAADKTVDVVTPSVKKATKAVVSSIKDASKVDYKEELLRIKKLYEEGLITDEEYEALRKKILDI